MIESSLFSLQPSAQEVERRIQEIEEEEVANSETDSEDNFTDYTDTESEDE